MKQATANTIASGNLDVRWYHHSRQGVCPMISPIKIVPSVAANETTQAASRRRKPCGSRVSEACCIENGPPAFGVSLPAGRAGCAVKAGAEADEPRRASPICGIVRAVLFEQPAFFRQWSDGKH